MTSLGDTYPIRVARATRADRSSLFADCPVAMGQNVDHPAGLYCFRSDLDNNELVIARAVLAKAELWHLLEVPDVIRRGAGYVFRIGRVVRSGDLQAVLQGMQPGAFFRLATHLGKAP